MKIHLQLTAGELKSVFITLNVLLEQSVPRVPWIESKIKKASKQKLLQISLTSLYHYNLFNNIL